MDDQNRPKPTKSGQRDSKGRFIAGNKAGSGYGRPPVPDSLRKLAKESPERLTALADDPDTPASVKADICKWSMEMVYGKPRQQVDVEADVSANVNTLTLDELRETLEMLGADDGR